MIDSWNSAVLNEGINNLQSEVAGLKKDSANWETVGILGAKNLLPLTISNLKSFNIAGTWDGNAYTHNGVTYTVQTDNLGNVVGIETSGTASANSTFSLGRNVTNEKYNDSYILNGCASGGSTSTYFMMVQLQASPYSYIATDTGLGSSPFQFSTSSYQILIRVNNGKNVDNKVFKPMMRLASDGDSTFQPYAMTNQELTKAVSNSGGIIKHGFHSVEGGTYDTAVEISFNEAFTDNNYDVVLSVANGSTNFAKIYLMVSTKSADKFAVYIYTNGTSVAAFDISWIAIKTNSVSLLTKSEPETETKSESVKETKKSKNKEE